MLPFPNEIFTRKLFTVPSLPPHPLPSPRQLTFLCSNFLSEAHLWCIVPDEVKCGSLLNQYLKILSPCERQAVFGLNGAKLQKGALLARTLVRTTLSRYTQSKIMPQSLRFSKNTYGKPQVVWQHEEGWIPPCLHFNISHSSSLVACAVTVDLQVGIDVEDKHRKLKHDVLSFARRFFSPNEVEFLHGTSDPLIQQQEFVKLWTLKEAYVKALGRGFSAAPFRNFTVRHQESRIAVEVHSDSENLTENWQFALLELPTHYASICVEKAGEKEGDGNDSLKLKVWRTIPFVEDECISVTDAVV
ncbi:uncharacterized protein LOC110097697 isoform X1 [Dendrobium catenatum]|uniref:uncharacterized protein LOC110097697 isoform X1 n=1 Tax=Dendrobium catenatum TaxID=906689 RepID=UPI0009F498FB|nr:uncharacterized protein LOC110097697 isoform X1 [Dendrobium catenatum]XP_028548957.1 uncharacterized protein LOC110097697 isoform X1 [Dendrobium catenatum]XP_028548958.1 uncharacterized protein LOC110097697 isoform X1 [Dendrobium catenatum]XP_028548959.1 uncharacterized protein LOC110097697 isoform X1 [Dendrobium catenatum]